MMNNDDILNINTNIRINAEYKFCPIYQRLIDSVLSNQAFNIYLRLAFNNYEIISKLPKSHLNQYSGISTNACYIFEDKKMQLLCSYIQFKPLNKLILFNSQVHQYANPYMHINDKCDHYRFLIMHDNIYYELHYWPVTDLYTFSSYIMHKNGNLHINAINIRRRNLSIQQFLAQLMDSTQYADIRDELMSCESFICLLRMSR